MSEYTIQQATTRFSDSGKKSLVGAAKIRALLLGETATGTKRRVFGYETSYFAGWVVSYPSRFVHSSNEGGIAKSVACWTNDLTTLTTWVRIPAEAIYFLGVNICSDSIPSQSFGLRL